MKGAAEPTDLEMDDEDDEEDEEELLEPDEYEDKTVRIQEWFGGINGPLGSLKTNKDMNPLRDCVDHQLIHDPLV
jgi:hypothetical protein